MPATQLLLLKDDLIEQIKLGLEGSKSQLMMLPSYVDILPNGHESGDYYAIDIGGTNVRVMHVCLGQEEGSIESCTVKEWPIPVKCFDTNTNALFEWTVDCFGELLEGQSHPIVIGFCFSFALQQTALNDGKLLMWTKNFRGNGLVGEDVVAVLVETFRKRGFDVSIPAVINDTVATLMAMKYQNQSAFAGLILGTGTNCAYIEKTSRLKNRLPEHYDTVRHPEMAVNTEWGAFYSEEHFPMCQEDIWVDCASANPGWGHFEKMVSGLYVGEVARRILLRLGHEGGLFDRQMERILSKQDCIEASLMSLVETESDLSTINTALRKALGCQMNQHQVNVVKAVFGLVSRRSARLLAVGIAAVVAQREHAEEGRDVVIAVDGSMFAKYSGFKEKVCKALEELCGVENAQRIKLQLVKEGSVLGATTVVAAAVSSGAPNSGVETLSEDSEANGIEQLTIPQRHGNSMEDGAEDLITHRTITMSEDAEQWRKY